MCERVCEEVCEEVCQGVSEGVCEVCRDSGRNQPERFLSLFISSVLLERTGRSQSPSSPSHQTLQTNQLPFLASFPGLTLQYTI